LFLGRDALFTHLLLLALSIQRHADNDLNDERKKVNGCEDVHGIPLLIRGRGRRL
jgi:hypothetical protein